MYIDFLSFDKHHHLGENATGVIAHFSGPLSVKRVFQTTCCLPAKRQSLARDCSCPTGLRVLFLVVEVQSTSSSRLARKPEKRTLTPVQQRNLGSSKCLYIPVRTPKQGMISSVENFIALAVFNSKQNLAHILSHSTCYRKNYYCCEFRLTTYINNVRNA